MNSVAAIIRSVLLFAADESFNHSFICKIAISLVDGSLRYVARSLIASNPKNNMQILLSCRHCNVNIVVCFLPTGVVGLSETSDNIILY